MTGWLSLKISNKERSVPVLLISVPKKIVSLATRRNRIKRLIREVFRKETFFDKDKIYQFRVVQNPEDTDFEKTRRIVKDLIETV